METTCTLTGNREATLIEYLYDDIDPGARAAFETHLAGCGVCRRELEELGIVRRQLANWQPPQAKWDRESAWEGEPAKFVLPASRGRWRDIPAWAQVAAALLFVGVSAAVANLDVTYNSSGLSIRTGWSSAADRTPAPEGRAEGGAAADDAAPWRVDLAALETALRAEMRSSSTAQTARSGNAVDADALLKRVRTLIADSEQRQQRELALRIAEVDTSVRAQRYADLRNIDRNFNVIQSNTGVGMRQLYRMTNDLAVRVSQTR
jgi:hypothetical protein